MKNRLSLPCPLTLLNVMVVWRIAFRRELSCSSRALYCYSSLNLLGLHVEDSNFPEVERHEVLNVAFESLKEQRPAKKHHAEASFPPTWANEWFIQDFILRFASFALLSRRLRLVCNHYELSELVEPWPVNMYFFSICWDRGAISRACIRDAEVVVCQCRS